MRYKQCKRISSNSDIMANTRALLTLVVLSLSCSLIHATVFSRCRLTRELLKMNFSRTFLSNWVCLIEQESERNTAALVVKTPRRKYYGLFQIGSEWCKEGRRGGKCDMSCESFLNDDIRDDATCAQRIFEMEGFKYWSKWEARCKGHTLPDIEKCPEWQFPSPRSSPARDKRNTKRTSRSIRLKFYPYQKVSK
ncbi:hypothetical protein ACJJTC_001934 [Scirpophaga incertulas]